MFFMPESPYYLIGKGKEPEALKSLIWLRGTEDVKVELAELKNSYAQQQNTGTLSYKSLFTDR